MTGRQKRKRAKRGQLQPAPQPRQPMPSEAKMEQEFMEADPNRCRKDAAAYLKRDYAAREERRRK